MKLPGEPTKKDDVFYAIVMEWPTDNRVFIGSLADGCSQHDLDFNNVAMLGGDIINFNFNDDGLYVMLNDIHETDMPIVLKIH